MLELLPVRLCALTEASQNGVDWGDRSYLKALTCVNHPDYRWLTKNPWDRTLFFSGIVNPLDGRTVWGRECPCAFSDLRVMVAVSLRESEPVNV